MDERTTPASRLDPDLLGCPSTRVAERLAELRAAAAECLARRHTMPE
jgi:hypothetical protein